MTAVAAILTSLGIGAILAAVVTGLFGRRKVAADAAAVIGETARELLQPLRERLHEMADEEKRLRRRVEDLESDLRWLRAERADQIRRDVAMQSHMKALNRWVDEWVPRARMLGLDVSDPPPAPDLMPLIDPTQLFQPRVPAEDQPHYGEDADRDRHPGRT